MSTSDAEVIIFCQAPAKIPMALACYEESRKLGRSVAIIAINAVLVYEFIKSLKLDLVSLTYCPCHFVWAKNPVRLYKSFLLVWQQAKELGVFEWHDKIIYFSCISCDQQTHAFVWWLRKRNRIVYMYNVVDESVRLVPCATFVNYIKLALLRIFFGGVQFVWHSVDGKYSQGLRKDAFENWHPSDLKGVLSKYARKVTCGRERKCAIFFSNPYRDPYTTEESYIDCHIAVAKRLKDLGYWIVGKGHPRLGVLKELDDFTDEKIPDYLPAEFLDLDGVSLCVGLTSTSICATACKGLASYSFLPLLETRDQEAVGYWHEYLKLNSNGKIQYINTIDFNM